MKRFLGLFILSCPFWLHAQGYELQVQGQKQQAMGNTGTALIQDGAAVFYNPGGVSFLRENSVSAGGNAAIVKSVFLDAYGGSSTKTKTPISAPFAVYGIYGFDSASAPKPLRNMKFGLGIYTPAGTNVVYPDKWVGQNIVNSMSIKTICIQPTVSYKIKNKIGFGIGFVFSTGSIHKNVNLAPFNDSLTPSVDVKGKFNTCGFNAGIYYTPTDKLAIGLTYRSQLNMDVKNGTATFSNIPTLLKDSLPNGKITTTLPIPKVITLGAAYKLNEQLTLTADISFIGFKVFDSVAIKSDNTTAAWQEIKKPQPRMYKNTYSFNVGGQYLITDELTARAGVRYVLSAISNGYVTPEGADANYLVYSAGVGYKILENLTIDASYSFQSIKRTDNNTYYQFNGTYKTYASIIGLSLSYNF